MNDSTSAIEHEFRLLDALATTPDTTQAGLANQVGIAIGTVNWYLQRWSKAGYLQIERAGRRQWRYELTPEGIAHRQQLTRDYIDLSFALYRHVRAEAKRLLSEVAQVGVSQVVLIGDDEIVDICRLTCLELELEVIGARIQDQPVKAPIIQANGVQIALTWPMEINNK